MLTVDEALSAIAAVARPKPTVEMAADEALGLTLAESIASDVDSPPHDKSVVDGYAVMMGDLAAGPAELEVIEEVTAGRTPTLALNAGQTTRVMTGAPIPTGADAVVMLEKIELIADRPGLGRIRAPGPIAPERHNITRRGASFRRGVEVLAAGATIRPIEIGVLAEVGRTRVRVTPAPTVAILPTGDELVGAGETPGPGQIRNTNGPMLVAAARRLGATPLDLGVGPDEPRRLRELIERGLAADVLLISGGVSAGVLDLAPGVLKELGVEEIFHKVRVKPGKPLWFGVARRGAAETLVFGLPGNPVSGLVCFELFVRPALERLSGRRFAGLPTARGRLATGYAHEGERPTYHPARIAWEEGEAVIAPLSWRGSGDLATLAGANGLACFPSGERKYAPSDALDALLFMP